MPDYPKYTTTVIGAHSVPRWYEALDRLVTLGQLQPADIGDAQYRAMQAAILEQEIAGIDVITGGECIAARITGIRRRMRCSIISGRRSRPFTVLRGLSRSPRTTPTSPIRPRSAAGRSATRPISASLTNLIWSPSTRASRSR